MRLSRDEIYFMLDCLRRVLICKDRGETPRRKDNSGMMMKGLSKFKDGKSCYDKGLIFPYNEISEKYLMWWDLTEKGENLLNLWLKEFPDVSIRECWNPTDTFIEQLQTLSLKGGDSNITDEN